MKFNDLAIIFLFPMISFSLMECSSNDSEKKKFEQNLKLVRNDNKKDKKYLLSRGKYLVSVIGCGDCHSPKIFGPQGPTPDSTRALSGHPATEPLSKIKKEELKNWVLFNHMSTATVGPWGVSYASNITSDATGIGNWSEKQFFKAMREGKYKGLDNSRPLLPPMPWPNFKNLSDEDLKAIFQYLKSTKPVKNVVPAPISPADL
ncbi:diheme cytochrome c-553 [Rhodocytophaga aerolata]|uniref:Diheme cytochrome c-553 n=1 Tax=Rhodocytophaga aerolata TaxID=455078 RepID=A0ABT8RDS8_9BACT|nr:c-type cytochrome [Rhodocytophaga aerolata]MDO1450258.1 diheme cytochrome c-553 [Rhodocytophaga aerolata]